MSTYTLYYQAPVVHAQPAQHGGPQHQHPSLQLQLPQSNLLPSALTSSKSAQPPPERFALSSQRRMSIPAFGGYDQPQSPFFRLPAELRNEIYEYLLCPDAASLTNLKTKTLDLSLRGFNQTSTSTTLYPAILSTCRKANEEAVGLLYTRHTFHAHPNLLNSLPHLTSQARPVLYPSVTSKICRWQISLRLDTDPRFSYQEAKRAFSGAEYLEIRVWQSQFEAADYAVLNLFTGVRGVGIARVGGSVDEKVAGWLENLMMQPEDKSEAVCRCRRRNAVVCGRCHGKVEVGKWIGPDLDVWRFGGR
ncbi:hypothetical protein BDV96DRAFT_582238 [Lophiotrema nucula]|uniref:DUF7730 domain-containing protein n=1 Tax=Lophiotrema nucula TaxID=690887 RepID=A0A6A5YZE5_9PLEO|nr:hypothetical protein BDV96DRAFT_582238 [Lophiotrema nucula]